MDKVAFKLFIKWNMSVDAYFLLRFSTFFFKLIKVDYFLFKSAMNNLMF